MFENLLGESKDTPLDSLLVPKEEVKTKLPTATIKTRSATAALLSPEDGKTIENYQLMVNEGMNGSEEFYKQAVETAKAKNNSLDMKTLMGVLGDPNLSLEKKRAVIKSITKSPALNDPSSMLLSKSLSAPSGSENVEQEASRVSFADSIAEVYRVRQQVQGIVNAHAASLRGADIKTLGEFVEVGVVPFATASAAEQIASKQAKREGQPLSLFQRLKAGLLAGSTYSDIRTKYENLPLDKRAEFVRGLTEDLANDDGLIISGENHFAQYMIGQNVLGEGGYGTVDKFLDNAAGVLDIVGLGFTVRGLKGIKKPVTAPNVPAPVLPQPETIKSPIAPSTGLGFESNVSKVSGSPTVSVNKSEIEKLEDEKAGLLGDAGNLADRGAVRNLDEELNAIKPPPSKEELAKQLQKSKKITSKEAKAQAETLHKDLMQDYEAKVSRINSLKATNQAASTLTQRVADLEKRIEALKKGDAQQPAKLNPIAALFQRIETNNTVAIDNPASAAKVVQQANPEQSRALHEAVVTGGDEAAAALYGTSKTDAIASDILPQAKSADGAVRTRVADITRNLRKLLNVPPELISIMHSRGHLEILPEEAEQIVSKIRHDFSSAEGLVMNEAMSSFGRDGGRVQIAAVYGTKEGGFLKADQAIEQAKQALRAYGVIDDDIEILAKSGLDHVPVSLDQVAGKEGNYLIRVKMHTDMDLIDVVNKTDLDVKLNFFDRFSGFVSNTRGSLSRWIADAASMLDKSLVGGAVTVSDVTAKFDRYLVDLFGNFDSIYKTLPKESQAKLDNYFRWSNKEGVEWNDFDMKAEGWSSKEIAAAKEWRKFWDAHFYLENYDIVRSLNSQGFQIFQNEGTELFAKPIAKNTTLAGELNITKNSVEKGTPIYNPATDSATVLVKQEIDDLYNNKGTLARLRRPIDVNGVAVEYMMVRNTPTEYLRKFRDTDRVLNYRPGYYQVNYTAPKFIDQAIKDNSGKLLYWKTLAVAGDTEAQMAFIKRMQEQNPGVEYRARGDDRALARDSDAWWDVNSAKGRVAQRRRGERLESADGVNELGDGSYILHPAESAIRASRSIAGRTISRPMLETAKARFISQYGSFLTPNNFGELRFPNSIDEIGTKGRFTDADLAAARTTFEYINYLENGYINGMDVAYKQLIQVTADALGKKGFTRSERFFASHAEGDGGPISLIKNLTFAAYIGTNVLRQWVIQPHQVIRTIGYNPIGWANGKVEKYAFAYVGSKMGIKVAEDSAGFVKFVDDSGFLDNVDKQNLVRGVLRDAADGTSKTAKYAAMPFNLTRRIGFDVGEQANMVGHLSAVYEKYIREGKNLNDKFVRDQAYSEARAISYDMNFAGDMPYNQTSPAMIMQFMQVPHKAFLQLTNRRIDPWTRLRLAATDTVFWGTPAYLVSDMLGGDILPEDEKLREVLVFGFESFLLNNMFEAIAGKDVNIDFSGLAPYDLTGWGKMFMAIREGGVEQLVLSSPAAGLFFKDGSRMENAIMAMARYFNVAEDLPEHPETFLSMMNEIAKISSGYNNAYKAALLLETQKRMDQYGSAIEDKQGKIEAFMQVLGFTGGDTRDWYALSSELSKNSKAARDQWDRVYEDAKRLIATKLETEDRVDPAFYRQMSNMMLRVYKDNPEALSHINKRLMSDFQGKDQQLLYKIVKGAGIPDVLTEDNIRMGPGSDEMKDKAIEILRGFKEERARMKEEEN